VSARIVAIIALIMAFAGSVRAADVSDVRIGVHPDKTRMVIELSEKLPYRVFTLQDPHRLVIDLPEVEWKIPPTPRSPTGSIISSYRFGLFQSGNSRLVVDIDKPAKLVNHILLPSSQNHPYRLVLDLEPVKPGEADPGEQQFASTGWVDPPARATITPAPAPKAPTADRKGLGPQKRIVVLDPGHGGPDPGAISVSGVREKELTLQVARAVKRLLEGTGRCHLTRNEVLPARCATSSPKGRERNTLHADSNGDPKLQGASIYPFRERLDREARRSRRKPLDAIAGIDPRTSRTRSLPS
jgi:N-acetylmuramoyl-L-alanine amidase